MTTIFCWISPPRRLSALAERLARVIHPAYIPAWLSQPNPALDGDRPIDRIAQGDDRSAAR
jgi:hypothetical protein